MTPRVLMLGWEFPPFITGGLGTACHGLTRAMSRLGLDVTFVLPKHIDASMASHVRLLSPGEARPEDAAGVPTGQPTVVPSRPAPAAPGAAQEGGRGPVGDAPADPHADLAHLLSGAQPAPSILRRAGGTRFLELPIRVGGVYQASTAWRGVPGAGPWVDQVARRLLRPDLTAEEAADLHESLAVWHAVPEAGPPAGVDAAADDFRAKRADAADYGGDLVGQAERYARFCVRAVRGMDFDVIHAHDWLTYPAGLAVARMTGRPLVVHVHSTEFDRSGEHVNQPVYNIERRGMHGSVRVIAVSMLTRNLCVNRYGVPPDRVDVVYNGVDLNPSQVGISGIQKSDKIVLYFGRITMQKGPEYFIAAARRVLDVMEDVKFVVAGSGDQAQRMIEMAAGMGIGSKVLFTGFLRGRDIQRVFAMADLYVMPSVSEPFGIAPLEAMSHRVPVLISRTSGVSEILVNALKCDFWDVDDMANKIVAVLRHPPLQRTLREQGLFEVRGITWDGAARKCLATYQRAMTAVGAPTRNGRH